MILYQVRHDTAYILVGMICRNLLVYPALRLTNVARSRRTGGFLKSEARRRPGKHSR
jgi:hypothetical protein